jgi:REP element-mobilizing transposase RayT
MPPDTRIWHHVVITTYGAWLHGDARGFRTRHHREHIVGDYRNPPPPGMYADEQRRSRELLAQPSVVFMPEWRPRVGRAVWQELTRLGAWLLAAAVAAQHAHLLVKLPRGHQRQLIGRAKRYSTLVLRERGWEGKLWAVRSKAVVIRDRAHQLNTFEYILRHAEDGAWVGVWKTEGVDDGPPSV